MEPADSAQPARSVPAAGVGPTVVDRCVAALLAGDASAPSFPPAPPERQHTLTALLMDSARRFADA